MFATERNSSICVKSIQRNSSSPNPHLPMASGDFSMPFSHDFASSFRPYFTSTLQHRTQAHTHTIFDHGLQMGVAPCFGVLDNVLTLRPRFSHFPPPLCRGASLRISHPLVEAQKIPHKPIKVCGGTCSFYADGLSLSDAALTRYLYTVLMCSGNTGIAPCEVHTKALVSTAARWISSIGLRLNQPATKAAVKESPAPTVSATSTLGVS